MSKARVADKSEGDLANLDHQSGVGPAEAKEKAFHTAAARVHAARMARPDLLRPIGYLARFLS